jgi:hypothetical protein
MRKNYREDELPPLMDSPAAQPAPAPQSPPDVQSVLGDPAFRAFLAQRAQALSQAQTEAGDASGGRTSPERLRAGRGDDRQPAGGPRPDRFLERARPAPVTQLQQRQAGESQAIKDVDVAQQMQERGAKASRMRAEDDPNSDLSRRAKMLAVAQKLIPAGYAGPYSASMHQDMLKGASIEQARAHSGALEAQAKASMAETHASHQETGRHNKEMEDIARGKSGKSTAVLTKELAHAADAVKQLDDYGTQARHEGSGPMNG